MHKLHFLESKVLFIWSLLTDEHFILIYKYQRAIWSFLVFKLLLI